MTFLMAAYEKPLSTHAQAVEWPFEIDWSAPAAIGLEQMLISTPVGMVDLVTGDHGTRSGSADRGGVLWTGGKAAYFDGVDDKYTFASEFRIDETKPFTVAWECHSYGFIDDHQVVATLRTTGTYSLRISYSTLAGYTDICLQSNTTASVCRFALPAEVGIYDYHRAAVVYDGSQYLLYLNGHVIPSAGVSPVFPRINDFTRVGGTNASYTDFFGAVRQVLVYSLALSSDEAVMFSTDTGDRLLLPFSGALWIPELAIGIAASGAGLASGTASLAANYNLGAIGLSLASGTASLTASVPLSAAGASISSGSAGTTALVSISAAGLAEAAGQAGLDSSTLLAAAGAAQASGNAALATRLEALAAGAAESSGSASLLATLTFSASGGAIASGSADLQSVIAISADGFVEAMGSGTLWLRVDLAAAGAAQASGSAGMGLLLGSVLVPDARYVARLARRSYRVALPTP